MEYLNGPFGRNAERAGLRIGLLKKDHRRWPKNEFCMENKTSKTKVNIDVNSLSFPPSFPILKKSPSIFEKHFPS